MVTTISPNDERFSEGKSGSAFLACCFYTDKYALEAEQLRASLDATGIAYFLKRYPSRGYWEANTRIKPEFLLHCLERFPDRNIVYLDADCVVRSAMVLFDAYPHDIGVFKAPPGGGLSHPYLTGTLFLRNTPRVHDFVRNWISAQGGMVLGVDQDSFTVAVERDAGLDVGLLPASYVKIFDRGDEVPVVEHFQASRQRVKLQRTLKKLRNVGFGLLFIAMIVWLMLQAVN
ncbi:hypothetical protein [Zoogloea sp.]|uniref:hypothetical protein n=1 Tax=Zoogloea sp. TaxID=49181 RepID=UPI001415FCB6|nr:MAG: hypothetical protein F9K15_14210 [Zoogloea sp.]